MSKGWGEAIVIAIGLTLMWLAYKLTCFLWLHTGL